MAGTLPYRANPGFFTRAYVRSHHPSVSQGLLRFPYEAERGEKQRAEILGLGPKRKGRNWPMWLSRKRRASVGAGKTTGPKVKCKYAPLYLLVLKVIQGDTFL